MTETIDHVMTGLRRTLDGIAPLIPRDRPVVYLDYPVHLNVGDLLIHLGAERWLADHGYDVPMRASLHDATPEFLASIPKDATVICHGGGNFGDLYPVHQKFRERVVESLPGHRIVLFPQTLHYADPEKLAACAALYAKHPDLHILLRDTGSLELGRKTFSNPVYLMPDTAHYLWHASEFPVGATGARRLNFVRRDPEASEFTAGPADVEFDWDDRISPRSKLEFRALAKALRTEGQFGRRLGAGWAWNRFRDRLIRNAVQDFSGFREIATNRLHGMILACLLAKPVQALDNSYGKLGGYYHTWLEGADTIQFIG